MKYMRKDSSFNSPFWTHRKSDRQREEMLIHEPFTSTLNGEIIPFSFLSLPLCSSSSAVYTDFTMPCCLTGYEVLFKKKNNNVEIVKTSLKGFCL